MDNKNVPKYWDQQCELLAPLFGPTTHRNLLSGITTFIKFIRTYVHNNKTYLEETSFLSSLWLEDVKLAVTHADQLDTVRVDDRTKFVLTDRLQTESNGRLRASLILIISN